MPDQLHRRALVAGSGAAVLASRAVAAESTHLPSGLPEGTLQVARFADLPEKRRLIELVDRPPNYATPIEVFSNVVTPNERFFVRYHVDGVPSQETLDNWSLTVSGDAAAKSVKLTLGDLNSLPQNNVLAVCQCAGNRRGFFQPHVAGVQWPNGGMGCAIWRGPALRDVLNAAGVKAGAVEIWLEGADEPPTPSIPKFRKSLPMEKAMDAATILATSMNSAPIPRLNGYPVRLVVPGWTGTYWLKHLTTITISTKPLDSFWMKAGYRIPAGMFPVQTAFPSQAAETTVPITELVVNSVIADPLEGAEADRSGFTIQGVAWDRGNGISRVEVSLDGGKSWQDALLDGPLGNYAYRRFSLKTGLMNPGTYLLASRATSNSGEKQADTLKVNPGGYHNNVPRPIPVVVR